MKRKTWRYAGGAITATLIALAAPMAVAEAITHAAPVSGAQASTAPAPTIGGSNQDEAATEHSAMSRAMVYSLMGAGLIVGMVHLLGGRRDKRFAGGD